MSRRPTTPVDTARPSGTIVVFALLALAALAWVGTAQMAAPDMSRGLLTRAGSESSMSSGSMSSMAPGLSVGAIAVFLLTWLVMMAAMMLPAVSPVVAVFDGWVRRSGRSRWATVAFVGGYLLAWTLSGLVAYGAVAYLESLVPSGRAALRWGGVLLVLAGAYQLSPLKSMCLTHCRTPVQFVARHAVRLRQGGSAAARVGAVHGLYCLGCCWALMMVILLVGMMSLVWMALVAAVILAEKMLRHGALVARAVSVLLIAAGAAQVLAPHSLPSVA